MATCTLRTTVTAPRKRTVLVTALLRTVPLTVTIHTSYTSQDNKGITVGFLKDSNL